MLRTMDRPTKATFRLCLTAVSSTCCTRCTWEAKQATMIRWSAWEKTSLSTGAMSRSDRTMPGTSALVESDSSRSTPSAPSLAKPARSVSRPSRGSWSILKSPVCSTTPAGVLMATAMASGIEWLTAKNSQSKGPNLPVVPSFTSMTSGVMRCSVSLERIMARVSFEPTRGISARSRSK